MMPWNVAQYLPDTAKIDPIRKPAITAASTTSTTVLIERWPRSAYTQKLNPVLGKRHVLMCTKN